MSITILYTQVTDAPGYAEPARRFLKTYEQFKPAADHELVVCQNDHRGVAPDIGAQLHYTGQAKDCGAYLFAARHVKSDWMLCCNSHVYFWRHGWLEEFASMAMQFGEGLYGAMASNEVNPHVRTCCMFCRTASLLSYPHELTLPWHANSFECGLWSFTDFMKDKVFMVSWNGYAAWPAWRDPMLKNIFRRGDQSSCLVFDRHSDIYRDASPEEKLRLEKAADGK